MVVGLFAAIAMIEEGFDELFICLLGAWRCILLPSWIVQQKVLIAEKVEKNTNIEEIES